MEEIPDPVGYLTGRWRLERSMEDLAGGGRGWFRGVGEFRPEEGGLAYVERGELCWDGQVHPAERRLRYRDAGAGRLRVEFSDGRHFHDLDLTGGRCVVTHPCRADAYTGEFEVDSADRWRQVWRVRGPAKDKVLRTVFSRDRSEW